MNFGQALDKLKNGASVRRPMWLKGTYIVLLHKEGSTSENYIAVGDSAAKFYHWKNEQSDLLAEDWE